MVRTEPGRRPSDPTLADGTWVGELDLMPEHFAEHLRLLWASSNAQPLREAETLLTDTVQLVQAHA